MVPFATSHAAPASHELSKLPAMSVLRKIVRWVLKSKASWPANSVSRYGRCLLGLRQKRSHLQAGRWVLKWIIQLWLIGRRHFRYQLMLLRPCVSSGSSTSSSSSHRRNRTTHGVRLRSKQHSRCGHAVQVQPLLLLHRARFTFCPPTSGSFWRWRLLPKLLAFGL